MRLRTIGVLCALVGTGCAAPAASTTPPQRPSASASQGRPETSERPAAGTLPESRGGFGSAAAFRKWGLEPMAPAPVPPQQPLRISAVKDPWIKEIPTDKKIVFLTFDDGNEKDPRFIEIIRDLRIPFTMFLTDDAVKKDYGYFRKLQALGNPIENHTLTHTDLKTLNRSGQQREICGAQEKFVKEFGQAPRLFRPPFGSWNDDTLAAMKACDLQAMVLWRVDMGIEDMEYQRADRTLRPGQIILAHFRGPKDLKGQSLTDMTANMLRRIQEQGFTVARLEDYLTYD
ncbi:polysaccharide deacetylase family protein [Streptomyces sp. SP18CS02]|uniref:polysaccharide deacetylase family protein n=1 Tax=Streptomyces sp. SP18CS02 TaxID=3002531 RepID=UPI002E782AB9|nr:polysaccharide deacetylase family protein [Streptomyces sp. SP18CS02]MEE1751134.1 polysaccharide deacetylase family protein [Streptomyces sp. SP18CS02]